MIVIDCEQGGKEWQSARLGIPTSSKFGRILTAKSLKPSGQSERLLCELLAERILGISMDTSGGGFMDRGSAMEASAAASYSFQHDVVTRKAGFVLTDDRRIGCSPDRFVGDDGLLEIKCPSAPVHIATLLGFDDDAHRLQVQGQLWLTGRRWCDLLSYSPELPPAQQRIARDGDVIAALSEHVTAFAERLDAMERILRARIGTKEAA